MSVAQSVRARTFCVDFTYFHIHCEFHCEVKCEMVQSFHCGITFPASSSSILAAFFCGVSRCSACQKLLRRGDGRLSPWTYNLKLHTCTRHAHCDPGHVDTRRDSSTYGSHIRASSDTAASCSASSAATNPSVTCLLLAMSSPCAHSVPFDESATRHLEFLCELKVETSPKNSRSTLSFATGVNSSSCKRTRRSPARFGTANLLIYYINQ